jgi:hypothetical protein
MFDDYRPIGEINESARGYYGIRGTDPRKVVWQIGPDCEPETLAAISGQTMIVSPEGVASHMGVMRQIARDRGLVLRCSCLADDGPAGVRTANDHRLKCRHCDGEGYL